MPYSVTFYEKYIMYVMRHKCHVRWHDFHFKRMLIKGLFKTHCYLNFDFLGEKNISLSVIKEILQ